MLICEFSFLEFLNTQIVSQSDIVALWCFCSLPGCHKGAILVHPDGRLGSISIDLRYIVPFSKFTNNIAHEVNIESFCGLIQTMVETIYYIKIGASSMLLENLNAIKGRTFIIFCIKVFGNWSRGQVAQHLNQFFSI